jgi:hypothetical protein
MFGHLARSRAAARWPRWDEPLSAMNGIAAFERLVAHVMGQEPYRSASRVFLSCVRSGRTVWRDAADAKQGKRCRLRYRDRRLQEIRLAGVLARDRGHRDVERPEIEHDRGTAGESGDGWLSGECQVHSVPRRGASMTDVAIGLLKVDKNVFGGDTTNREQQFSMTVMQANSALKAIAAGGVRVFVAPEYFWSEYGQIGKRILQMGPLAMDRDDKHGIYDVLKRVSKQAGSLVIVAGSIFYKKPNGGAEAAYNVCPVLQNGGFLLKSYKQMDDGAAGKNAGSMNFSYKDSVPYFRVGGVRFGIEVCGEHQHGASGGTMRRLKDWATANGKTIDIQLLASDSMPPVPASVIATKYFAQCDCAGTDAAVRLFPAGGPYDSTTAIQPVSVTGSQVNGGIVYCYKVSV